MKAKATQQQQHNFLIYGSCYWARHLLPLHFMWYLLIFIIIQSNLEYSPHILITNTKQQNPHPKTLKGQLRILNMPCILHNYLSKIILFVSSLNKYILTEIQYEQSAI